MTGSLVRVLFIFTVFLTAFPVHAAANPKITALVDGVNNGAEGPTLSLSTLAIDLKLHGSMAEFAIEAQISNPSNDAVEGRFSMQLPKDAVLIGYALDVNGRMVPGSLIDQPKAKQVYEDEVRAGIDPGLAEITTGNVFNTRVYPIAAEGSRTITLRFVTKVDSKNGLSLPLETAGPVGEFTFNADITGLSKPPLISFSGVQKLPLKRSGAHWRATNFTQRMQKLSGTLKISDGKLRQKTLVSQHSNRELFFTIEDGRTGGGVPLTQPGRLRIYWDRSRSHKDSLIEQERALLQSFLATVKAAEIDIVRFASDKPDHRRFTEQIAVDAHIAATSYRGATSFSGLDDLELEEADVCLLFSDGGATVNERAPFKPDCPLIIIASGPNSDGMKLNRLARDSHGELLYLTKDNGAELLKQMRNLPLNVIDIRDVNGDRVKFRNLPAGADRWSVVGELPRWGDITVRLSGLPKGKRQRIYSISTNRATKHDAAGALWAAETVAALAEDPSDRDKMRKMAEKFQVASPTMAFLVLEQPRQYIRAEIDPPAAFNEEWMEEYSELKSDQDDKRKTETAMRFNYVLTEWDKTKKWWATRFDQKKAMRQAKRKQRKSDAENAVDAAEDAAAAAGEAAEAAADAASGFEEAPPPPPPSPSQDVAEPAEGSSSFGFFSAPSDPNVAAPDEDRLIIVTASRRTENAQDSVSAVTVIGNEITSKDADGNEVKVSINDVLSDQPYLAALDKAEKANRRSVLTEQEKTYGALPAFYLDVSEWFRLKGDQEIAIALLLSALELPTTNDETRLVVAFRLQRAGRHDDAIALLERMEATSGYRPQPKRTLALALAERSATQTGIAKRKDLERAFKLLSEVSLNPAISNYNGIETIALMEANSLIPLIEAAGGSWMLDGRLVALLDTDIRIVIEWTNADADLDLWITEPTSEQASYNNNRTLLGGKMSDDMTRGYGPEEYVLRDAIAGGYAVRVQGFSGDRINPNGPGRVMVRLIRNFGRPNMQQNMIDSEIGFDRSDAKDNDRAIATMTVTGDE